MSKRDLEMVFMRFVSVASSLFEFESLPLCYLLMLMLVLESLEFFSYEILGLENLIFRRKYSGDGWPAVVDVSRTKRPTLGGGLVRVRSPIGVVGWASFDEEASFGRGRKPSGKKKEIFSR
ncbi:hypothetical protein BT93_F0719 [Corymbia citriodora subsp. variegata]|nr:hypothetical protein BT93_F0719 [Corymbia citriodora subsp. variegata]